MLIIWCVCSMLPNANSDMHMAYHTCDKTGGCCVRLAHLPLGNTRRTTKGGIKHNDLRGTSWGWMGGQTFNHQLTASANDFVWWFIPGHTMDLLQTNIDCVIDQFMFNTKLNVLHWKLFCFDFNMSWVHTSPTNSTSRKLWLHNGNTFNTPQNKKYNLTVIAGYLQCAFPVGLLTD